ncbi:hypothetical protein [Pseudomonas syringae group genomosp. 3]|uniref:hypothetical protein n=1 Tax=Pseudomonas syringae group genomosp. 3 TaxID=251701 RepID=UPI0011C42FCB|nr:hypothetical protein [Pseudomonas syringae group genomosp. 3]
MARTLSSAPSILCEKQMTIGLNEAYFIGVEKQLQKTRNLVTGNAFAAACEGMIITTVIDQTERRR